MTPVFIWLVIAHCKIPGNVDEAKKHIDGLEKARLDEKHRVQEEQRQKEECQNSKKRDHEGNAVHGGSRGVGSCGGATRSRGGGGDTLNLQEAEEYVHINMSWALDTMRHSDEIDELTAEHVPMYPLSSTPLGNGQKTLQDSIHEWLGNSFDAEQQKHFHVSSRALTGTVDQNFTDYALLSVPGGQTRPNRKGTYLLFPARSVQKATPGQMFAAWSQYGSGKYAWEFGTDTPGKHDQYLACPFDEAVTYQEYDGCGISYTAPSTSQSTAPEHCTYTSGGQGEACTATQSTEDAILPQGDYLFVPIIIEGSHTTVSA